MSFGILWFPQPRRYIEKLPKGIAARIHDKISLVLLDPFRYVEPFVGEYYKIRIGEYRLLCDIDSANKILRIRIFDKRERIY